MSNPSSSSENNNSKHLAQQSSILRGCELQEFVFPYIAKGFSYIYLLFDSTDRLIYIGQTSNILQRMSSHLQTKLHIAKIKYIIVSDLEVNEIEAELILEYDPPENTTIPANSIWIGIESFQKQNESLKGKRLWIKKKIKEFGFKPLRGYYRIADLKQILSLVGGVK